MSSAEYLSLFISSVSAIAAIVAACVAGESVNVAKESIRKSMTAQVELYVLDTLKNTLRVTETKKVLTTIDYWCKLIINDCLDRTLTKDNEKFIRSSIETFKDDINRDRGGYNNIIEYAEREDIPL